MGTHETLKQSVVSPRLLPRRSERQLRSVCSQLMLPSHEWERLDLPGLDSLEDTCAFTSSDVITGTAEDNPSGISTYSITGAQIGTTFDRRGDGLDGGTALCESRP